MFGWMCEFLLFFVKIIIIGVFLAAPPPIFLNFFSISDAEQLPVYCKILIAFWNKRIKQEIRSVKPVYG